MQEKIWQWVERGYECGGEGLGWLWGAVCRGYVKVGEGVGWLWDLCANHIKTLLSSQSLQWLFMQMARGKAFVLANKRNVALVAAATVLFFFLLEQWRRQRKKGKKRPVRMQSVGKTFLVEDGEKSQEESTTGKNHESEADRRERRRKAERRGLDIIAQSQTDSQEDKKERIFFQMYRNYQET